MLREAWAMPVGVNQPKALQMSNSSIASRYIIWCELICLLILYLLTLTLS
jgi:hypothetical protein